MKYVLTNNDGEITGFYESGIKTPPQEAKKITEKEWKEALSNNYTHYIKSVFSAVISVKTKEDIENNLIQLADSKQEDAYRLVLGYKSTTGQIERYKDKYERAIKGEFTKAKNSAIIAKFNPARDVIRNIVDRIEYFREEVDDLIQDGQLDKAEKAIEAGKSFGDKTTQKDVETLLSSLS